MDYTGLNPVAMQGMKLIDEREELRLIANGVRIVPGFTPDQARAKMDWIQAKIDALYEVHMRQQGFQRH